MKKISLLVVTAAAVALVLSGCGRGGTDDMEMPDEQPMEMPDEQPMEMPDEQPMETPDEQPMETPDEQPMETPDEQPMETPDEQPMMPSLDGTWHFAEATVEVQAGAFTVRAGDGTMPLGAEGHFAMVTMAVVKGTIAPQDGAYLLTVGTDEDSVQLTFADTVAEELRGAATRIFTELLMLADDDPVMIEIDAEADPVTMTVTGSFITTLLDMPAGTELVACMGTPCVMPS